LCSLEQLTYPNVEVIVVNDGSRDKTGEIARRHSRFKLIETANAGLSAARNVGLAHATREIVAYTDADTRVDPDWLTYLVQPFITSDVVGSGGPNVVPADDPPMAQCIARAPGAPTHVLLDDRTAEHVPGCNMAFKSDALLAIGGFNAVYLRAGDAAASRRHHRRCRNARQEPRVCAAFRRRFAPRQPSVVPRRCGVSAFPAAVRPATRTDSWDFVAARGRPAGRPTADQPRTAA